MFIAALFTVAKIWKQHKCASLDERINKMLHVHACTHTHTHTHTLMRILLSHKNKNLPFVTTLMNLEGIMPSEINYQRNTI